MALTTSASNNQFSTLLLEKACDELRARAVKGEPVVTPPLIAAAEKYEGHLQGLEHKLKSKESLFRKVLGDMDLRRNQLKNSFKAGQQGSKPLAVDPASVVNEIGDALRYTMIFPLEQYTTGVEECLNGLKNAGVQVIKCKNFWQEGDNYQGINAQLALTLEDDPLPLRFELQFHTQESFDCKMSTHDLYEKFRIETDPEKKLGVFEESIKVASNFPIPADVMRIPVGVFNSPPSLIDMWATKLSDQAEKEEPAVTKAMESLFGHNLRGLEFRRKMQPSIMRKLKQISSEKGIKVDEAAKYLTDALRYTVLLEPNVYTRQVKEKLLALNAHGDFKVLSVANFWKDESTSKGVYAVVSTGVNKLPVEVQFHTAESYRVKETTVDEILIKIMLTEDREEAHKLYQQAEDVWKKVPTPAKAAKIAWPIAKKGKCVVM